jgi:hyperosmotically inducible protein
MRTLLRAVLVLVLFTAVAFLALGFWTGSRFNPSRDTAPQTVGTAGQTNVDKARERGAAIGEKAAVASQKVGESMEEAALTAKIKAKMMLDDKVKARAIDVTTDGSTVTVSGTVGSAAERERVLSLVRDTAGVTRVVDRVDVR